jgi:hypothetical protein
MHFRMIGSQDPPGVGGLELLKQLLTCDMRTQICRENPYDKLGHKVPHLDPLWVH